MEPTTLALSVLIGSGLPHDGVFPTDESIVVENLLSPLFSMKTRQLTSTITKLFDVHRRLTATNALIDALGGHTQQGRCRNDAL